MSDVVISPQTIALVGALLLAISALSGAIVYLYRQALRERDRLLDALNRVLEERDARLVDIWRDMEEKEIRIATLEAANERLLRLATEATEGWQLSVERTRERMS